MSVKEEFTVEDLEASLRKSFVEKGFETILYDGHVARNEFLRAGIAHGVEREWLFVESEVNESQYTAQIYALTKEGKKYFGLVK